MLKLVETFAVVVEFVPLLLNWPGSEHAPPLHGCPASTIENGPLVVVATWEFVDLKVSV